jgi:hypothetical protein
MPEKLATQKRNMAETLIHMRQKLFYKDGWTLNE